MGKYLSKEREKMCNMCGEMCLIYTIVDNAPLCNDCVPVPKKYKKLLNESQMLHLILEKGKEEIKEFQEEA